MFSELSLAALTCLCFAVHATFSQTSFGRIGGTVTDISGAPIPNAKVSITNTETQIIRTAETGIVEGPGLQSYDLSLANIFPFHERYNLRFQADAFNAFNVSNFTGLVTDRSNNAFETLPTAYPPRNLQL